MADTQDEREIRYRNALERLAALRARIEKEFDDLHDRQRRLLHEATKRRDERLTEQARKAIFGADPEK